LLITGGTGFVGGWIARTALSAGHAVRVVARDPASESATSLHGSGVEVRGAVLADRAAMAEALDGVEVLVHAAATYAYDRSAGRGMVQETPTLSRAVLDSAAEARPAHVIDISSAIVFKPHDAGPRRGVTDIDSPRWSPADRAWGDPYLASKVLADEAAEHARERGLAVSSVHPALVIGPEDSGPGTSGTLLLSLLHSGAVPDVAAGWCDVRDVAEAVLAIAALPPGGRYLVTAETLTFRNVCHTLDGLTGKGPRRVFLPRRLVAAAARLNDLAGGRLDARVPPRASIEYLLGTRGPIDGSSGLPALGLTYRSFATTVSDSLDWWARNGMLDPTLAGATRSRGR
jgi:nucleoside-diphosphate-sugar epimerase